MVCKCGHEKHDFETGICIYPGHCFCTEYREAVGDNSVIPRHQKYLEQYEKVDDKVKYILENIPETKEMLNKDFVFFYWLMVSKLNIISNEIISKLDDPESIRRCRQLLVQHNREKYGPKNEEFLTEKNKKQDATYQFVMEKYL